MAIAQLIEAVGMQKARSLIFWDVAAQFRWTIEAKSTKADSYAIGEVVSATYQKGKLVGVKPLAEDEITRDIRRALPTPLPARPEKAVPQRLTQKDFRFIA